MMTSTITTSVDPVHKSAGVEPLAAGQKVVIVNGTSVTLELLETVLEAGHYNVVFVEAAAHAYSQIKRVKPNLVILCVQLEDMDGFQVLSMLKLDPETRDIQSSPIRTNWKSRNLKKSLKNRPEQKCSRQSRRSG
jgi:CheY-like chemotaxis protein